MSNIAPIVLVVAAAITVVILLIWKNKKLLKPDAQDSVEESMMDKERRQDRI